MNPTRPDDEAIFHVARQIGEAGARSAYLDQVCGSDRRLRGEVEALLSAYEQDGGFLETPALSPPGMADAGALSPPEGPGAVIGPYKLLEEIGEGGMGTVFMAEQVRPVRRKVALKVIKPGIHTRQIIARFEAERQALAMMDHDNIARVFDAGATESGRPYFVMELVRGVPITEFCDRERMPVSERLELFVLVCRAVQHAHQKGIIHRDIKPTNVLITLHDGAPVPKVIDFGIAKAIGQDLTDKTLFTGFAQLLGTPLYMSPEQAEMSGLDVDTRSDIYSLGVLLYELLTGTTPFDPERLREAALDEVRRIVREEDPPRPSARLSSLGATITTVSANRRSDARRLDRDVRGELDWIALKALEKDRRRRYETANTFADDILRYLDDRPVEACPPSWWYRSGKFGRRHRVALVTTTVVTIALVAGTLVSAWQAVRATRAERLTAAALAEATAQRRLVDRDLIGDRIQLARQALDRGHAGRAQEILATAGPRPGDPDPRGFAWHHLWQVARGEVAVFQGHRAPVRSIALSPDGLVVASGDDAGFVLLADPDTGRVLLRLRAHAGPVEELAFSADGRRIATASVEAGSIPWWEIFVWDAATGLRVASLAAEGSYFAGATFTPSGGGLVVASRPRGGELVVVDLHDLSAGRDAPAISRTLRVEEVTGLAMEGDRLVGVPVGGRLTGYDLETLEPAWSADGARQGWPRLAAGGGRLVTEDGRDAIVWEAEAGRPLGRIPFERQDEFPRHVEVSPDGGTIVALYEDERIFARGVDAAPGAPWREIPVVRPGEHRITRVTLSGDGSRLAVVSRHVGGGQGPLTVWETATGRLVARYPGPRQSAYRVAFTADGASLLLNGSGGVQRWNFERPEGASPPMPAGHGDEAWSLAFSPAGDALASGGDDDGDTQTIRIWDPATSRLRRGWFGGEGTVAALAFAPDGSTLASAHLADADNVRLWDPATGHLRATLRGHAGRVRTLAYRPGGGLLATGGDDATIRLWDLATGQLARVLRGHKDKVRQLAFSPDGATLASTSNDRMMRLWDVATGIVRGIVPHGDCCTAVAFSRDGATVITGDEGGTILFCDPRTGQAARQSLAEDGAVSGLALSADGLTLASAGASGTIHLWDPATGFEQIDLKGHAAPVNAVAFSPDGRILASCSHDGAVKLWRSGEPGRTP